jgi:hypothetical protein
MALELAYCPGFTDIPDAQLAAGAPCSGPALSAVKCNADFGPVAYEQFQVICVNGDQIGGNIPLPASTVDNYQYSQDECKFSWEISGTTNQTNGLPSGQGGLLGGTWNVDQATGKVTCFEVYQVEGGASTDSTDGVLTVTIHAIRAQQIRTIAAGAPTYTALSESLFTQDEALQGSVLDQLSQNAKCASVSVEPFIMNPSNAPVWSPEANITAGALIQPTAKWANGCWYEAANSGLTGTVEPGPWPSDPGYQGGIADGTVVWNLAGYGFMNGQQVPFPTSGVDEYAYSAEDTIVAVPFHASTFALPRQTGLTVSSTSGEGNILSIFKSIVQTAPTAATAASVGAVAPVKATASLLTVKTIYPGMSSPPTAMSLMSANPAAGTPTTGAGIVSCGVEYENGNFDDGTVHVLLICTRKLVASVPSGDGAQFTDFATTSVLTGNPVENTDLNYIIQNSNFGILRPEIFVNTFTEADILAGTATVPVPTSASGYVYSRAELQYLWYWTTTGASGGRLRDFDVGVNAQTGVVDTRTDYFLGSYKSGYGNIGTAIYGFPGSPSRSQLPNTTCGAPGVVVITFARRSHETELQPSLLLSTPGTSMPAPPSQNNLLPDPDFQLWSRMQLQAVNVVGVADDWYQGQDSGTTAFLQETGIIPGSTFAQGIGCQCTGDNLEQRESGPFPSGAPAAASVISDLVAIAPGGLYSAGFMGKASPDPINYGLYFRVHVVDINGDNDTYFSLLGSVTGPDGTGSADNPGAPLATSPESYSFLFTMPTNGATAVNTSSGLAVLSQTLTFIPAYCYVEILLWSPIYSSYGSGSLVLFAILNKVFLEYLAAASSYLSPGGVAANITAWSSTATYAVGNAVTWEGGLYVCIAVPPEGTPPSNAAYWQAVGTTTWEGVWSSTATYAVGNIVSYNSTAWICVEVPPVGTAPATGSSYWTPMGIASDFQGAWNSTTAYTAGQEVSAPDQFGNPQVWICLASNTGQNPATSGDWSLLSNVSYQGAWSSSATYSPANQVSYAGSVYLALTSVPADTVPGTNGSYWLLMGSSAAVILTVNASSPVSNWVPTALYLAGAEVDYNGNYYIALQDNSNAEPDTSTTDWQLVGTSGTTANPLQPWNSTTAYNVGDEVTYSSATSGTGSVGPVAPGTVTALARENAWVNPNNAAGTSAYATCTLYGSNDTVNESGLLQFTNFNFSGIPAGATITGIAVSVKRYQSSGTSATYDDTVTLVGLTGDITSHVQKYPAGEWPSSATAQSYGSSSDLWGVMPTLAQIQASTFGFEIGCQCTLAPGTGADINLNSATATVYYATSGQTATNVYKCIAANTNENPASNPNYWQLVGPATVDAVEDGESYARTVSLLNTENMIQNPSALIPAGAANGYYPVPGWTAPNPSWMVIDTTIGTPAGSGPCFAYFPQGTDQAVQSNNFVFTPGATYLFTGWYSTDGSTDWAIYGGPGGIISGNLGKPTSWTQFSYSYTVPTSGSPSLNGMMSFAAPAGGGTGIYILLWGLSVVKVRDLDNEVLDGSTYQRTLATALTSGQVDLSKAGVVNKTLEFVADASGRAAVVNMTGGNSVASVDSENLALINFASAHENENLEYIADGGGRYAVNNGPSVGGLTGVSGSGASAVGTSSSLQVGAANSQISESTTSYVDVTGGTSATTVQTAFITPNGGYVKLRFYAQIASTNSTATGYSVNLFRSDGTEIAEELYGSFVTGGDGKFLTIALEGVDTSPGTSEREYACDINTNSGGTVSLIPVLLIAENAKR